MHSYRKFVSAKGTAKFDTAENDLESGIDRLLKQLQQVNSQMQAWVSSEIFQDLTQVFCQSGHLIMLIGEH